ncbi:hypothetical protein LTR94_027460, partial [Friedmanniomyces endolithicus]
MIDRVEVLRDGASSVYGSDAVAGVVNIQTRKNFEGLIFEAQHNAPMEANGNGGSTRLSLTAGARGDRWRAAGSIERYERDELTMRDREFTRCQTDGRRNGRDYIDPMTGMSKCYPITGTGSNGSSINTIGTGALTSDAMLAGLGGIALRPDLVAAAGVPAGALANGAYFDRWRPNVGATTGVEGFEAVGGAYLVDRNDPKKGLAALNSNIRRSTSPPCTLNALGDAEVYGEFLLNVRESSQTSYRQLALDYAKGSPLIPGSLTWSTFSADQGLSKDKDVGVRAFIGFGNDRSTQEQRFNRNVIGIKGDFFAPEWRYDLSASYSKSRSEYTSQQFLTDRLSESLDVVSNGAGGFQCRELASNPGCVAAPALTSQTIGG